MKKYYQLPKIELSLLHMDASMAITKSTASISQHDPMSSGTGRLEEEEKLLTPSERTLNN